MPRPLSERQEVLTHGPRILAEKVVELEDAQVAVWEVGRDLVLAGMSYAAVGRLLGVSAQAARARFSRHVESWRHEHGSDVMPWDVGRGADLDDDSWGEELEPADQWDVQQRTLAQASMIAQGGRG